jgi:hypothetical protein
MREAKLAALRLTLITESKAMEEDRFIVRRPRHEALPNSTCRVIVEGTGSERAWDAELTDVSRQGLKLLLDANLPQDARVCLCLEQPANQFSVTLACTVRWSRLQDDGRWGAGCIFDQELSWELMGELFLHGILSADSLLPGGQPACDGKSV